MITIYGVQHLNEDGRAVVSTDWYMDSAEAEAKKGDNSWWINLTTMKVWEKGERKSLADAKQAALDKLTQTEKEILGIKTVVPTY